MLLTEDTISEKNTNYCNREPTLHRDQKTSQMKNSGHDEGKGLFIGCTYFKPKSLDEVGLDVNNVYENLGAHLNSVNRFVSSTITEDSLPSRGYIYNGNPVHEAPTSVGYWGRTPHIGEAIYGFESMTTWSQWGNIAMGPGPPYSARAHTRVCLEQYLFSL